MTSPLRSARPSRPTPRPPRRTQLLMVLVMVAVVGGGMLAGRLHRQPGAVPTAAPTARGVHVIEGTVLAPGDGRGGCGTAPAGVAAGASVVVVDQWGRTLAGATLGSPSPLSTGSCSYPYQAPVPESAHYRIQVADLPPTDLTGAGLAAQSWRVVQQDG